MAHRDFLPLVIAALIASTATPAFSLGQQAEELGIDTESVPTNIRHDFGAVIDNEEFSSLCRRMASARQSAYVEPLEAAMDISRQTQVVDLLVTVERPGTGYATAWLMQDDLLTDEIMLDLSETDRKLSYGDVVRVTGEIAYVETNRGGDGMSGCGIGVTAFNVK